MRSEKSLRSIHFLFIFMPFSLTCCLSTNLTAIFSIDQVVVQKVKESEKTEQDSLLLSSLLEQRPLVVVLLSHLDLLACSSMQCGDVELEKKIDEKIGQFIDRVEKHPSKKIDEKIG
ncbi:Autophagy-related protein 101 [Camellia lanceoleosa]|uniref:Autophagy-related protein 101 n=1 Tax=Camellia lanceoleosa TaxID=1840588 RepID=A0ACC0FH49_9ERIC|nr:Autophagy-related protein 101 [Camellia lanceoleosa]